MIMHYLGWRVASDEWAAPGPQVLARTQAPGQKAASLQVAHCRVTKQ